MAVDCERRGAKDTACAAVLTGLAALVVRGANGTYLRMDLGNRVCHPDDGLLYTPGKYGNLPAARVSGALEGRRRILVAEWSQTDRLKATDGAVVRDRAAARGRGRGTAAELLRRKIRESRSTRTSGAGRWARTPGRSVRQHPGVGEDPRHDPCGPSRQPRLRREGSRRPFTRTTSSSGPRSRGAARGRRREILATGGGFSSGLLRFLSQAPSAGAFPRGPARGALRGAPGVHGQPGGDTGLFRRHVHRDGADHQALFPDGGRSLEICR